MHISVLLDESIKNLNLKKDSIVVDCTLGYAGHSSEILKLIPEGFLYAFDQDSDAIKVASEKLSSIGNNFKIINSNFTNLKEKLNEIGVYEVDAILYDLGVSSPQLDVDTRGFSFHNDSLLDMRMDQSNDFSAYNVVNEYELEDLISILRSYGEEKYAVSIAKGIVKNRPIKTTLELTEVIKENVPFSYRNDKHPARKTFQAIRIEVNKELDVFESSINQALELVGINGRIGVITFHSLEDKMCKSIFKQKTEIDKVFKNLPIIPLEYQPSFKLVGAIKPSKNEIDLNRRSRSAMLRVIERIK